MMGGKPDEAVMKRLQKVGEVLAFDKEVGDYFAAEYKMNGMVMDIYKIIAKASDLDTGITLFSDQ